jgi:hypothetical protein
MIPPAAQQFLAKRMGATVKSVASSHAPFVAHPHEAADIIALAAASLDLEAEEASPMVLTGAR